MRFAVIPARGGSKGLPKKNILPLLGKPLIVWTIEAAKNSKLIDEFVVSTDSLEIADIARLHGAQVLMRPEHLATDEAKTIDVLKDIGIQNNKIKSFILLQPTSPFRPTNLIDDCIKKYESADFDTLATGFYCKYKEFGTHNNLRRQDYKGFFYDDGSVYIWNHDVIMNGNWFGKNIFKYENNKIYNFEIDDEIDFSILELLMSKTITR